MNASVRAVRLWLSIGIAVSSGTALADSAETLGGIGGRSVVGRFEARLGGRIHFDGSMVMEDEQASFGSPAKPSQGGFYFRRLFIGLNGKAYGWKYKMEGDFANDPDSGASRVAFQEAWFGTAVGPGELQFGQRRPFRGMEDLTGTNNMMMIEKPFASAAGGMFGGGVLREFQNGIFYHGNGESWTWGVGAYSLRAMNTPGTEGLGESVRLTWAPLLESDAVVHLGFSLSFENADNRQGDVDRIASKPLGAGRFAYAGFRGPTFDLGTTPGSTATAGLEYANAFGPFFAQAEAMYQQQVRQSGLPDQDILAFYLQAGWFLTGESRPYRVAQGVFGAPQPQSPDGAWELTARFEQAAAADPGYTGSSCRSNADSACQVTASTVGVNYYVTPNVRFMLNYTMGRADRGDAGTDQPSAVAVRCQMAW